MSNVVAGKISVQLVADTAKYVNKLKKSSTQTNKQVKKMEKQIKRLEKTGKKSFSGVSKAMSGLKASAIGAALAFGTLVIAGSKARLENERLAKAAGMTGDAFDNTAAAFGTAGVSAEQTSDMLRDLNLKIAEAAVLGGGAAAEAMEKLGIKLKDIKDKTPEEQMLILNKRMQELNLTGDEQKTLWDSLASDMDRIQPLLANGAAGYIKLKDAADELNVKIPEKSIQSLQDMGFFAGISGRNLTELGGYIGGEFSGVFKDVAPHITNAIQSFIKWNEESHALKRTIDGIVTTFGILKDTSDILAIGLQSSFLLITFGLETLYDTIKYQGGNIGIFFDGLGDTISAQWDISFAEMANSVHEFMMSVGESLDGVPGLSDIGKELKATAAASIAINNKTISNAAASQAKADEDKFKREVSYNEMRLKKLQEFWAESKRLEAEVMTQVGELAAGGQDLTNVITGNGGSGSGEEEDPLVSGSMSTDTDPEIEAQKSKFETMLGQYTDYLNSYQKMEDDAKKTTEGIAFGEVDKLAEKFDLQLDLQGTYAKATAAINSVLAAVQVWGDPALSYYEKIPASIAALASVAALGGQFHSGTDHVASEGSYLLQKGERVVQPKANKKLTSFLDGKESGGGGDTITIDSPMHVAGNVTDQNWFKQELYKHRQLMSDAVKKAQREKPRR